MTVTLRATRRKRRRRRRRRVVEPTDALNLTATGGFEHTVPFTVAEQMRLLVARTDLCSAPACVAITSTVHGEGASDMARSLAAVVAHDTDKSVALVEFDREDEDRLTIGGPPGYDETSPIAESRTSSLPGLSVISMADVPATDRSAFANSDRLLRSIGHIRKANELVILDLPPVSTDASVLALTSFADAVLFVVRSRATPTTKVQRALDDLGRQRISGIVLTGYASSVPKRLLGHLDDG